MQTIPLQTGTTFESILISLRNDLQIVHWRNHLKFPEDTKFSLEAKDLICRLLCDVEHRLGTGGAAQIKVRVHKIEFHY